MRAWLLAAPLALAACATTPGNQPLGRDFSRAPFASFTLDITSVAEAEAALGPPMKLITTRGLASPNAQSPGPGAPLTLTALKYFFYPDGPGTPGKPRAGKAAILLFFNGRLIAYGADSSLPGDANPPIDEARLDSLHQCRTTRREAIALLGQPNAESLHLFDTQPGAVDIAYSWENPQQGLTARRSLRVFFDRSGAMSNYRLVDDETAVGGTQPVAHATLPTQLPPACPNVLDRQHT